MPRHARLLRLLSAFPLAFGAGTEPLSAQSDSVTVIAGPAYEAGDLHSWLLGSGYRDLWTTPMRVEVLDFTREQGGLTPVERGGNVQTMALRFRAPDGSEYNFRSIDKELTPALPPHAQETLLDWIRQDVTSAQMPLAPIVATPLLDAVGVLNPAPRLVVLPDDPALGEFRDDYGGMLGTFEHHPNEVEEGVGGFAGSVEVKGTDGMLDDLEDDPVNRADTRAFLTARLVDMLLGDWDRHEGQWRWARYDRDGIRWWVPIPEDRDYAFVDYGGVLIELARLAGLGRLVSFDEQFSSLSAMMANSLELNRRLLANVPREEWDSVAAFVQERITDEVIADAVARVPEEVRDGAGGLLATRLRSRRDALPQLSASYYAYMAEMVEIHATDADETAEVVRQPDGSVDLTITTTEGMLVYRRSFSAMETKELRIDLHGGNDAARVTGSSDAITVRILGGGGDDRLGDLGRGPTALYDSSGENELTPGPDTHVDRREYSAPEDRSGLLPDSRSDWGTSVSLAPVADWRSHVGVVVGGSATRTRYGFRQHPYSSKHSLTAVVSPLSGRGGVEYRAALPRENSDRWLEIRADATTMNAVRFHGFGNATEAAGPESRVWLRELSLEPRWHVPIDRAAVFVAGAGVRYTDPSFDPAAPAAELLPFGAESLGQVYASGSILIDSRDQPWFPTRGIDAEITGMAAPPVWDLASAYSRIDGSAASYLPFPVGGGVLALRGGGARVWGAFPFQASAFLGGSHSLRGFQRERFAGDAAIFGNAELRVPLVEMELLMRGDLGVSGLLDVGRVFVDGDSPEGWHHARGGSVWFATPELSVSLTYAYGEDHRLYADFGLPF
jgi:hypothetical protein